VARLLVAIAVVALVLVGIWVTGGLITNDFGAAMGLTAAWLALAGLIVLVLTWRRPGYRVPAIGAYVVTAGVAGAILGWSTLRDDEVDERVVAASPPAKTARGGERESGGRNVAVARGRFVSKAHPTQGTATVVRMPGG
jgi:hypothetical protein